MTVVVLGMFGVFSCGGGNDDSSTSPALVSIAVTPAHASITRGMTRQFSATGTYSDGSAQDLTSSVTWSSSETAVATISDAGLSASVGTGSTIITASFGTISGNAALTVTAGGNPSTAYSPFGINAFYIPEAVAQQLGLTTIQQVIQKIETDSVRHYKYLGADWGRIHPDAFASFAWNKVDSDKDGMNLDFSGLDGYVKLAQQYDIDIIPSLSPESDWPNHGYISYVPSDLDAYKSYVRQVVERYDGDGISDMPGLMYAIKYWQLDNEADLHFTVRKDGYESPAEYYEVLKATCTALKEADPSASLMVNVLGLSDAITTTDYISALMGLGASSYFDVFSYHGYPENPATGSPTYDPVLFQNYFNTVKGLIGGKPIWITETAIAGETDSINLEQKQAGWLVKNYVFHLANGVKRLLWLDVRDGSSSTQDRLARYGGLMKFDGTKKLSYYSYKKMVDLLQGSDWSLAEMIQESQYVYVYKFIKNGKPVLTAWWDYFKDPAYPASPTKQVSIMGLQDGTALVTESVPKFATGAEVTGYATAFNTSSLMISNGSVTLTLGENPVFVEVLQ